MPNKCLSLCGLYQDMLNILKYFIYIYMYQHTKTTKGLNQKKLLFAHCSSTVFLLSPLVSTLNGIVQ